MKLSLFFALIAFVTSHKLSKRGDGFMSNMMGGGILSNVLGGNTGDGGLFGLNIAETLGDIIGESDDPQRAAKTQAFFGNLKKLCYNILTNSLNVEENKYLAHALMDQVRAGGFCDLKHGNTYAVEFGKYSCICSPNLNFIIVNFALFRWFAET
jgi:hypothetical protein